MEALLVNIENKNAADFIKKVLKEFSTVTNIQSLTKEEKVKLIDALEEEEDIRDYKAFQKKKRIKSIPFNEVLQEWKRKKMILR